MPAIFGLLHACFGQWVDDGIAANLAILNLLEVPLHRHLWPVIVRFGARLPLTDYTMHRLRALEKKHMANGRT
jgi:hypothetical protein